VTEQFCSDGKAGTPMEFTRLEKNICDVIKEEQVKLGYRKEAIRLYYPLQSLNRFLKANLTTSEMTQVLERFCDFIQEKLGDTEVSHQGERFCFFLSPKASEYVYQHTEQRGFLYDFIHTVSAHPVSVGDIVAQFEKYSDHVHVEKVTHGEFDVLVYFEDGKPDDFRYCLTEEGEHVIYHRFTPEDYEDFHFGD
jgi:hypothetical protein